MQVSTSLEAGAPEAACPLIHTPLGKNMQTQEGHTPEIAPMKTPMTLAEFLESDLDGYEYVKGTLIPMPPTSAEHGRITTNLFLPLGFYVREHQLGDVYTPDTGFQVGERMLIPDIAFITNTRIPADMSKAFPIPPGLAVEVVSQTDVSYWVEEKVFAYLDAGTQRVWLLKPRSKTVTIYRSETDITLLTQDRTLTGEDVVPGFSCQVATLFE